MGSKVTDEELMERYAKGSMEAFEKLYDRHKALVYGYLGKRVPDRFDRDEIHQNVFLKLHRSRHKYNRSFPFLPWLFTICRSVLIDFMRAKETKEGKLVRDELILDSLTGAEAATAALVTLGPALSELKENQIKAIEMRYGENFSFEEIARKLDTSEPNARQMISRAVRKLKGLLNTGEY